jgi:parvulin-like peptidyl-prolyl isomerase
VLDFIRKSSSSFMAWLILGALALAFGLSFGLPSDSLTFGEKPIVEVHGNPITKDDFQLQFTLVRGFVGVPKDPRMQQAMGVKEEVLESAIEREVLAAAAQEVGLEATHTDAEDLVASGHIVVFGDTFMWTGVDQFNYKLFQNFLRGLQVSENRYYELQRREFLARTMRDVLRSSVVVPESEVRAAYDAEANRLSLRYARYEVQPYADLVDPSDDDVTKWLEEHRDELKKTFETQGSRFAKLPKQARVGVIEVAKPLVADDDAKVAEAKAKLEAARARVAGGEDFRRVAREVSEHDTAPRGGDFGWVSVGSGTGIDPVIDEKLAELGEDALTEVLEGESAFYVVRVSGLREGDVPEEDALLELAEEAFKEARGKELARTAAEEDRDAVLAGKALGEVFDAAALGESGGIEDAPVEGEGEAEPDAAPDRPKAALRETGSFAKGGPIPSLGLMPELVDAAWASDPETKLLPEIYEVQGALVLAGLQSKEEATDAGYQEVRGELYAALWKRKGMMLTANYAERRCLEAKGTGDIVVTEETVKSIVTYDTPEGEAPTEFKPYNVCDRVGNQGGLLRAGLLARAGGGATE